MILIKEYRTPCYNKKNLETAIKSCNKLIKNNQEKWAELYEAQQKLYLQNTEVRTNISKRVEVVDSITSSRELKDETIDLPKDPKPHPVGTGEELKNSIGISQVQFKIPDEIAKPEERLKYYLETYYKYINYNDRVKLSHDQGLKAEFTMCLAQTETGIGHQLKSDFNYFNVGNNDRGNKVFFISKEQSFQALGKALRNKYLGNKTKLGELNPPHKLSKEVCENGDCEFAYATSEENWGNNMINCLNNIRG